MTEKTEEEIKYGFTRGKIFFQADDDLYARFLIQLQNEKLGKHEFFRALIRGFIDDDERLISFLTEYRESVLSKNRKKIMNRERKRAKNYEKKFGLSDTEIEDIFDLLEEEQGL